jgi:hypothetical protein
MLANEGCVMQDEPKEKPNVVEYEWEDELHKLVKLENTLDSNHPYLNEVQYPQPFRGFSCRELWLGLTVKI